MPADTRPPFAAPDVDRNGPGRPARIDLDVLAGDLSNARLASGTRDNLVGSLVERLLGIGLFLTLPFLLSAGDLGAYYQVVALITILVIAGVMGIDVALVRFTALASERKQLHEADAFIRSGLRIAVGTSLVLAAGLWMAAPWLSSLFHFPGFVWPARLGALAVPFLVGTFVLVAPARGLKLMRPTVLATQVCQPAVALLASLAFVLAGLGLTGAVLGFTVAAAASWLLAVAMLIRLRLPVSAGPRASARRSLLRFAFPVAGMTMTGTALLWIDTLLLGALRPASEVATYGIIVRLLGIGSAVLLTVIQVFGPFVTQLVARGDSARLRDVLQMTTRWVALVAAPALVLLALTGGTVLEVFHQPRSGGRAAMLVLASAFLIDAFTGPVGHVLTMSGRSWLNLANNAASLACNVVLNLLLIPHFGLVGAAISWAVVMAGVNVARILQVRRIFGVTPFSRSLGKPVAALGVAAIVAAASGHILNALAAGPPLIHLVVVGTIFLATYAAALMGLGANPDDRLLWRELRRSPSGRLPAVSG